LTTRLTKERLEAEIDSIESTIVIPRVRDIRISFALNISYLLLLIIFAVLANLSPSFGTGIASFGFGSLGIGANYEKLQKAVASFLKERRSLLEMVAKLRLKLKDCDGDEDCLEDVRDAIIESLRKFD
jgi:hypothetical protein